MKDYLVRGMSMDGFVKAVAIRSTELVRRWPLRANMSVIRMCTAETV